jgi:alkane 1-monooxygenase
MKTSMTRETAHHVAQRAILFFPFLVPLVFVRKVPSFHHDSVRWIIFTILYIYALPAIMDLIAGKNRANSDPAQMDWMSRAFEYKLLPWVLLLKIMILKILALQIIVSGRFDTIDCLGIAFLTGQTVGSYGIFVAHEFLHRKSTLDKALAEILMVSVMYPHYCIEHLYGHHKYAATPKDPATSRFGESLYAFLPRTVLGGIGHAWQLENRRLARQGRHWLNMRNRMLRYTIEVISINLAIWYFCGPLGIAAFAIQSVVAIVTLEVINYIQHYGLERKEIAPGRYQRAEIAHSWSSECWFSNSYWLNLGRHSDHHNAPYRSFQMLRRFEDEPELPAGFPAMFLLAFVPPLWFKVMNPRVLALREAQDRSDAGMRDVKNDIPAAAHRLDAANSPWYLKLADGSLALLTIAVAGLIGIDLLYGPPLGFALISTMCLATVAYRHSLARHLSGTEPMTI